jgi:hypothetical protein
MAMDRADDPRPELLRLSERMLPLPLPLPLRLETCLCRVSLAPQQPSRPSFSAQALRAWSFSR